jgi:tRNA wybutosine-synthesizing protein 2
MIEKPYEQFKKILIDEIPSDLIIIVLPTILDKYKSVIGKKYAEVLKCKTVLRDLGGIKGEFRIPETEILYGSKITETTHKENGIRYKIDPQRIMFSSGNMDERMRMANISNKKETIVDLFAGIGYFTLPIAVYSKPKKLIACEKNQIAFEYLNQNILLNDVSSIVKPTLGDNREVAPKNIANRVIMGYFEETEKFLPVAIECLQNQKGIIHYHKKIPDRLVPNQFLKDTQEKIENLGYKAELLEYFHVKSYAPGISHYVFDLRIGEK